jgi:transposase InsO family protein
VAVDKLTKWIEVWVVASVMSKEAAKFIENTTHCFMAPNKIVTDLGSAFTGSDFWDFCQDNLINVYYTSVVHPRYNAQVERANDLVLQGIKDRIFDDTSQYATRWLVELQHVIWGLRTQDSYRLLTILPGVRVGGHPSNRPCLRRPTHPALRSIVIMTGLVIKPVRPSVQWYNRYEPNGLLVQL